MYFEEYGYLEYLDPDYYRENDYEYMGLARSEDGDYYAIYYNTILCEYYFADFQVVTYGKTRKESTITRIV